MLDKAIGDLTFQTDKLINPDAYKPMGGVVELSPAPQQVVDNILLSLRSPDFLKKHRHFISIREDIRILEEGLKNPTLETRKDLFEDGREVQVIRIPLFRKLVEVAEQRFLKHRNDIKVGGLESIPKGDYRLLLVNTINTLLGDLRGDQVPFLGLVPALRNETGTLMTRRQLKQEVPGLSPRETRRFGSTVAELWLGFDIPVE